MVASVLPSRRAIVAALVVVSALAPDAFGGQEVDETQFKAAFIFNVAKFVEWPETSFASASDPVVACIFGDTSVDAALAQAPARHIVGSRTLGVRHIREVKEVRVCHILFVGAAEQKRWQWSADTNTPGVLTIGDAPGFATEGGMIDFRVEDDRVRISVNLAAAQRARLKLSSKLLNLCTIVRH